MITVEEVWARGLPPATALVAGREGLGRLVNWVAALRPRPPGFVGLKGGELALLSMHGLRELDGRLSLPEVLDRLADADVAAVAMLGDLHPVAPDVANRRGLPLLALPDGSDLHDVERQVARLLLEERSHLHRRGNELSAQLNELVIEGRAASDLADRLAIILGCVVAIEYLSEERLHLAAPRGRTIDRDALAAALIARRRTALARVEGQTFSPSDPPVERFDLPELGQARLVAPLGLADGLVGLLSIVGADGRLGEPERQAAARGAAACALALARERAVLEAADRLERDLVDELFSDTHIDAPALAARAARLGYDLSAPHLALAVSISLPDDHRNGHDPDAALDRAADLLTRESPQPAAVLTRREEFGLSVLLPLISDADEPAARALGRRLHELLAARIRPLVVSIGLAGPCRDPLGLRAARAEAERALGLGGGLFGPGHLTHFADLGLYRLLFRLHDAPEAEEFYREILGRLEAYDRDHGADLLPTLEAYFLAGASPKETAARLHLHRNTVLYRLQRIADISGHRLDDPQTALSLQLALRLRQTLSAAV